MKRYFFLKQNDENRVFFFNYLIYQKVILNLLFKSIKKSNLYQNSFYNTEITFFFLTDFIKLFI